MLPDRGDPRRPAVPLAVEDDPDHVLVRADGEIRRHVLLYFDEEDVDRIRLGYCCLRCGESQVDHGGPFPEQCYLCGYAMRDKQPKDFAKEFRGDIKVSPDTSAEEELAVAEELLERQRYAEMGWDIKNRKPQIWTP